MGLFKFFHKDEKEQLVNAITKRKKKLLKTTAHIIKDQEDFKKSLGLEKNILKTVEQLDPQEKAAVDKVLADDRTEEDILNYLAQIERKIQSLIESGDDDAIRTNLKKYVYTMNQLITRIQQLELTKQAQLTRIKNEEERLQAEAESKAKKQNTKAMADRKEALKLLKEDLRAQKKENKIARKQFYQSLTDLGKNSTKLVSELLALTASAAKTATGAARVAGAAVEKGAKAAEKWAKR